MNEEWKLITWIPDLPPDKYSISNMGRLRNNYTGKIRNNNKRKNGTMVCSVSTAPRDASAKRKLSHYTLIGGDVTKQTKMILLTISTQVAKAFIPPPQPTDGMIAYIGYIDNDTTNVRADNLEWRYRFTHSYKQSLKQKVNRKLSEKTVRDICKMLLEEHGNLKRIRRRIVDELPTVTIDQIMCIKYKQHYQSISDEYFDYYDKKFIPLQ